MTNNEKDLSDKSVSQNREIKFRLYRINTNVMLYDNEDNSSDYFDGAKATEVGMVNHLLNKGRNVIWMQKIPGLYDQNGLQVREGDILDFDEKERRGPFKPEVIWLDKVIGEWGYCGTKSDVNQWRSVIGNIYQNPELLSDI